MTLRFRDLPGFSTLLADYAEGREPLRPILSGRADAGTLLSRASRLQTKEYPREELADRLARQATEFGSGAAALANIEKLGNAGTVAVTACVSPDPLGGPLSAWFKALTAARLAAWLSGQGAPAVPIIILRKPAGRENLDVGLLSRAGPTRIELKSDTGGQDMITQEAENLLVKIAQDLEIGIEEADVLVALRNAYSARRGLRIAWAQFTSRMFEALGLILLEPSQPEVQALIRRLLPPEQERFVTALHSQQRSVLLAAGYGDSRPAEAADGAQPALENITLQSLLLPAAAQVIASSEAYDFACGQAAYAGLNSVPPVGWPCVSASIVDHSCRRIMGRLGLPLQDLFVGPTALAERLMQEMTLLKIADRLEELKSEMSSAIAELTDLVPAGERLRKAVNRNGQRMCFQIEKLKSRSWHAQQRRREIWMRQLSHICACLAPAGRRQEDEFAAFQFAVRHKDAYPDPMYMIIDPWKFEHQLIFLD